MTRLLRMEKKEKLFFTAHQLHPQDQYQTSGQSATFSITTAMLFLVIHGLHRDSRIKALAVGLCRWVKADVYVQHGVSQTPLPPLFSLFVWTEVDKHAGSDFFHQTFSASTICHCQAV